MSAAIERPSAQPVSVVDERPINDDDDDDDDGSQFCFVDVPEPAAFARRAIELSDDEDDDDKDEVPDDNDDVITTAAKPDNKLRPEMLSTVDDLALTVGHLDLSREDDDDDDDDDEQSVDAADQELIGRGPMRDRSLQQQHQRGPFYNCRPEHPAVGQQQQRQRASITELFGESSSSSKVEKQAQIPLSASWTCGGVQSPNGASTTGNGTDVGGILPLDLDDLIHSTNLIIDPVDLFPLDPYNNFIDFDDITASPVQFQPEMAPPQPAMCPGGPASASPASVSPPPFSACRYPTGNDRQQQYPVVCPPSEPRAVDVSPQPVQSPADSGVDDMFVPSPLVFPAGGQQTFGGNVLDETGRPDVAGLPGCSGLDTWTSDCQHHLVDDDNSVPDFIVEYVEEEMKRSKVDVPIKIEPCLSMYPNSQYPPMMAANFAPVSAVCSQGSTESDALIKRKSLAKASSLIARLTRDQLTISDTSGDTLLHNLIRKNATYLTEALIHRLDRESLTAFVINQRNSLSETPLSLAAMSNQSDTVRLLVERHANVNAIVKEDLGCLPSGTPGSRPLCTAVHYVSSGGKMFLPTLGELLKAPSIDLNIYDSQGRTALHRAVEVHGQMLSGSRVDCREVVRRLIRRGANVNQRDLTFNETVLQWAIERVPLVGNVDLVRQLVESAADACSAALGCTISARTGIHQLSTAGMTDDAWTGERPEELIQLADTIPGIDYKLRSQLVQLLLCPAYVPAVPNYNLPALGLPIQISTSSMNSYHHW